MDNPSTRVCVAAPPGLSVSETFIQSINEGLGEDVLIINGQDLNYSFNGLPISKCVRLKQQSVLKYVTALLPAFIGVRLRRKFLRNTSETETLAKFFRAQKVDVVLAHYGTRASCLVAACKAAGVALVPHFHGFDMSVHSVLEEYSSAYKDMFRSCHRVIAVSKRMKQDMIEFGCNPDKVAIIPYGPHRSFSSIHPDYQSCNIVMVGRLTNKKAPHLSVLAFAKAAERFPNLRLRVVGDGELHSVCRDLTRALGISGKVDFLGAADRTFIQHEFSNSFMFIQHSVEAANGDREGTPVAILEAGASGLPVVSTWHAGIPDVVISGETGLLVDEGDLEGMSNAICRLADNRTFASTLGTHARSRVLKEFTPERQYCRIRTALTEAVSLNCHWKTEASDGCGPSQEHLSTIKS